MFLKKYLLTDIFVDYLIIIEADTYLVSYMYN